MTRTPSFSYQRISWTSVYRQSTATANHHAAIRQLYIALLRKMKLQQSSRSDMDQDKYSHYRLQIPPHHGFWKQELNWGRSQLVAKTVRWWALQRAYVTIFWWVRHDGISALQFVAYPNALDSHVPGGIASISRSYSCAAVMAWWIGFYLKHGKLSKIENYAREMLFKSWF